MNDKIAILRKEFQQDLSQIVHTKDLENLKVKYLGKKGKLQEFLQFLKEVSAEERPIFGKAVNDLKDEVTTLCESAKDTLLKAEHAEQIANERIDISEPGRRRFLGRKHLVTQMMEEILDILSGMGFSVQYGPDIDSDFYNFEGLNYPPNHPARDMQDTFYVSKDMLLRSHTSNTQLRVMQTHTPPIRVVAPGTVYRNETISVRSHAFFHQLEGMYIDKDVSFADLLATMREFYNKLFKTNLETRFRPSYFPFTEPSMEVDMHCISCKGSGCRICKFSGWLEVAGAGMIHPEVLKNGGIAPSSTQALPGDGNRKAGPFEVWNTRYSHAFRERF